MKSSVSFFTRVVFASTLLVSGSAFGIDKVGVSRNGSWFLDLNGNNHWDGPATDVRFGFGGPTDTPVVGDWNGDGADEVGLFRNGDWLLDLNGNNHWDGPATDVRFGFGGPTDTPVVGDWNGDGTDEVGLFRNGTWFLDLSGDNHWNGPATDARFGFGGPTDTPVVGDWNGDGTDEVGLFRNGVWFVDLNGNGHWDGVGLDDKFRFGVPTDTPVVGDWGGQGPDEVGVFRNGNWFLDLNGNGHWNGTGGPNPDAKFRFGAPNDIPCPGQWSFTDPWPGCGDPTSGNCGEANGTPFCDDAECCGLICDFDPYCCDEAWDSICAGEAWDWCDGFPDLLGTYQGNGSQTLSGCQYPGDNGTYNFSIELTVDVQNGVNFSGTFEIAMMIQGVLFDEFATFTGTVDASGQLSGAGTYDDYIDGGWDSSGTFDFAGSLNGDTLTINSSAEDTSGDTCSSTGTATVTR